LALGKPKGERGEGYDDEDASKEAKMAMSKTIIQAMEDKDPEALTSALEDFVSSC
jgi:hypothetical protein